VKYLFLSGMKMSLLGSLTVLRFLWVC